MEERNLVVIGTAAGNGRKHQRKKPSDEEVMFRIVNRNSDRRRKEREEDWDEVNPVVDTILRVVRTVLWMVVGFFTAVGMFVFISLFS